MLFKKLFWLSLKNKSVFDDLSSGRIRIFLSLGGKWSGQVTVAFVPCIYLCAAFNLMVSFDGKNRGTSCSMWWCVGTEMGTELYGARSGIAKTFFVPYIALV